MKRLLLIDGMAVTYRAFYALNHIPRVNSKGMNTSAILGFTTTLLDLQNKLKPSHIGVAFDLSQPTFRHIEYPPYKANREATPEEIHLSIPYIKQIVEGFNIPILCKEGFEADDVIGTLSHKAELAGFDEVLMATPDKDFAQLVTSVVKMYKFGRMKTPDTIMGITEVLNKYHINDCKQVIDLLGLWGDSIDNIPGIPGVGEKSAQKLIGRFGSIEEIVAQADNISNNHLRKLVQEYKEQALLSKHLATIVLDAPIDFDEDALAVKTPNYEALKELFDELEFKQLAKRVFTQASVDHPELIQTAKQSVIKEQEDDGQLNLFAQAEETAEEAGEMVQLDVKFETTQWEDVVKVDDMYVCYDYKHLRDEMGVKDEQVFDVLLAHYLIAPESRHTLDFIASQQLNFEMTSEKEQQGMVLAALYPVLKKQLEETGLIKIYNEIELPLVEVLVDMEKVGVRIDVGALQSYSAKLTAERDELEQKVFELVGHSFNISSPKQLGEVLYDELKITDKPPRTAKKMYSTAEDALLKLKDRHPIVEMILEYRSINKLIGTYLDSFPKLINPQTGRLHTVYNQAVTATGRLSSSNPNLQNIPIRTDRGRYIRQAFVARDENYQLLAADYSQIELRLIADMSHDEHMISSFEQGHDIHAATAAKIFHIPIEEVSKDQRRNAKSVNFGIVYGISAFGLGEQLGCPRKEAQQLIDDYYEQFPAIKAFIEHQIEAAREKGYAETVLGRRRYLPEIKSRNASLRNFAERNAVNMPIQGTSADMIKIAMINIYREMKGLKSKMILQVHDELVFDVYKPEMEQVKEIVERGMLEAAAQVCKIKIEVSMDVGDNWLEAH